ncbi:MAG: hypothetical protein U1E35_07905 [Rhodospirillales bacterium]
MAEAGLVLRTLTGDEIGERHWDAFWRFYRHRYPPSASRGTHI